LLKPYAEYHDGGLDDQDLAVDFGYFESADDLKEWYCGEQAIQSLLDTGITVIFGEEKITTIDDIYAIIQRDSGEEEGKLIEKDETVRAFNTTLSHLPKEYMNEVDAKELHAKNLPQILIPELNIKGHDIYGGGSFLLPDENYLYIIRNNGRDGDCWAMNNYPAGGAGAIANRIKRSDAQAWMDEVEAHCQTSYFTRSACEIAK
jgi:hypothetical protein